MTVELVPIVRPVFCGGRKKQGLDTGLTCRRPSGWGTDHVGVGRCKLHGGCTPTHGAHASAVLASRVATLFGVPREDVDPISGLIEELQRSAGLIDSYEAMCVQLLPDDVVHGVLSTEESRTVDTQGGGEDLTPVERKTRRGAAVNTWVKMLDAERDRFIKLCETMVRLDLEGRRMAIGQQQVMALVQMLLSPELGLSDDQKRVAARMLRELDSSPAPVIDGEVAA